MGCPNGLTGKRNVSGFPLAGGIALHGQKWVLLRKANEEDIFGQIQFMVCLRIMFAFITCLDISRVEVVRNY